MSKTWYDPMRCDKCSCLMGYYIDCGPGSGVGICTKCYQKEPDTEDEDEDDDE